MNIINDSVNLGFMVQEVEKVIPEVVVHTTVQMCMLTNRISRIIK